MKQLYVCVETNAMGSVSAMVRYLPLTDFADGREVPVSALLPDHYADYVKPVYARLSDDGTAIDIRSEKYGSGRLPLDNPYARWESPEIGLSYAVCTLCLRVEDKD